MGRQAIAGMNKCSLELFNYESAAQVGEIDTTSAMAQSLSEQFMIMHEGAALEQMAPCVIEELRSWSGFVCDTLFPHPRQITQLLEGVEFLLRKSLQLLPSDIVC